MEKIELYKGCFNHNSNEENEPTDRINNYYSHAKISHKNQPISAKTWDNASTTTSISPSFILL